jgi:hypothetical protein
MTMPVAPDMQITENRRYLRDVRHDARIVVSSAWLNVLAASGQ